MKIAFVSHSFSEYCIRHVNEMVAEHDVLLMLPDGLAADYELLIDSRARFQSFVRARYRQPFRQLRSVAQIFRAVGKFRPDVIHFQNGYLYFNAFLPLLKKIPMVITIHDPRQHLGDKESLITPQWLMDFGFRCADRVIVHGGDLVDTVVQEIGIPPDRIHVIPHIAIGDRVSAQTSSDDGQTILFFGRIWEYKGLEYLIRAEPLVSEKFPNVRFVIGGKGENFERYEKLMTHPDRFEVHNNWIGDEARARMFSEATIVVLPYVEASQSGVIPIAYTHAKPVIATRVGGLPEMVEHGKTGLLIAPRDVEALARSIIDLLGDKARRTEMGRAGAEKLDRECSPRVVVQQTLKVYAQAVQDRGRALPASVEHLKLDKASAAEIESQPVTKRLEDVPSRG